MQFRAWRRWGIALLAAWVVVPTTMVEAEAATRSKSRTTIQRTAKSTKPVRRKARRRAARRPPPGGVYARSAIVLDPSTGEVLFEKNAVRAYPVASLTKLMTALVFLEQHPDLLAAVEITRTELTGGGHTQLRNSERVMLGDLLHMSLMCSDNVATRVLVRESGLPHADFLARMNRKAVELGLAESRFVEVTGLDEGNVSSATDIARLVRASADNATIRKITTTQRYDFRSEYRGVARAHTIGNTNRLLYNRRLEIVGGKTGFISEAGYCFATWIRTEGRDMIAVVLGAPTNATRFADVVRLVQRTVSQSIAPAAKT
jgi:D-alanyl-D-alanine endopeptidase (penicillin-binding protein 7)